VYLAPLAGKIKVVLRRKISSVVVVDKRTPSIRTREVRVKRGGSGTEIERGAERGGCERYTNSVGARGDQLRRRLLLAIEAVRTENEGNLQQMEIKKKKKESKTRKGKKKTKERRKKPNPIAYQSSLRTRRSSASRRQVRKAVVLTSSSCSTPPTLCLIGCFKKI
jgi:hypothetical protein